MSHHAKVASATNFRPVRAGQIAGALLATASMGILAIGQATAQTSQPGKITQQIIGRTIAESSAPEWSAESQAPAAAPNILLIMTDDAGFGASSTFGGAVPTPTFDRLAKNGLRYNQFNTAAICSPTRAALLTGRNPHKVGVGNVVNVPAGYSGYTGSIPKSAATVAELLKRSGYSTAMFGKAHVTPEWEQSAAGPFDRWPTGLGFQYFYGFLGGDTDQFAPSLVENTTLLTGPSAGSNTAAPWRPTSPSSSITHPAPRMPRIPHRRNGCKGSAASSTGVGMCCAKKPSPGRRPWESFPPTRN